MAIILSDLMANGALPYQGEYGGEEDGVTALVSIPVGTVLAIGDVIKIARVHPNVILDKIEIDSPDLDGAAALSASLGYVRAVKNPALAYNASTNPTVTGSIGADSAAFYAVTSTAPYAAGGVVRLVRGQGGLDNEFANNGPVAGFNDLAITVTVAGTATAAAGILKVRFNYVGLTQTPGNLSLNVGQSAYPLA